MANCDPVERGDSTSGVEPETVPVDRPALGIAPFGPPKIAPPRLGTMLPVVVRPVETVVFEKDIDGDLRCKDFRPHHAFRGKKIIGSEVEAWRVTRKMTLKLKRAGTYRADCPIAPYKCPSHNHWHTGQHHANVGLKPNRMIRFQLWVEETEKKVDKIKRQGRHRLRYWSKKING